MDKIKSSADTNSPSPKVLHLLAPHHRLGFAAVLAVASFFLAGQLIFPMRLLIGWDVFAFTAVILSGIVLFTHDPYEVRRNAKLQDSSATALFVAVISAATVSLFAVGLLLRSAKGLPAEKLAAYVMVSVGAIVCSWFLVHTLFALRYAHIFYFNAQDEDRDKAVGGLEFPGEETPNYIDFAYFSFVIGMTFQVSDVQITSSQLRGLVLVHGLISFCFNTAIVAMLVNIVAGLV